MKHKMYKTYMACAEAFGQQSYAKRKKVGAIAVTPQDMIIYSWNGTAIGDDNTCEGEDGATLDEVLHAELNIVSKAAREGLSLKGSTVFVGLSPCIQCAKALFQSGVERVVYKEQYRDSKGIRYLKEHGVVIEQYEED
ncbi:tRNA-specific adenosine deaminase [compost metagenome]